MMDLTRGASRLLDHPTHSWLTHKSWDQRCLGWALTVTQLCNPKARLSDRIIQIQTAFGFTHSSQSHPTVQPNDASSCLHYWNIYKPECLFPCPPVKRRKERLLHHVACLITNLNTFPKNGLIFAHRVFQPSTLYSKKYHSHFPRSQMFITLTKYV